MLYAYSATNRPCTSNERKGKNMCMMNMVVLARRKNKLKTIMTRLKVVRLEPGISIMFDGHGDQVLKLTTGSRQAAYR